MHSWEFPAKQGIGSNIVSTNDTANFLLFLQTLRAQDGAQNMRITAAVSIVPFVGPDGTPLTDVSGFAKVLDYLGSPSPTSRLGLAFLSDDVTQRS
jgi:chitinase